MSRRPCALFGPAAEHRARDHRRAIEEGQDDRGTDVPRGRRPGCCTSTWSAPASWPSAVSETTTVRPRAPMQRFVEQASWRTPDEPAAFVQALARTVGALRAAHPQIICEGGGVSLLGRGPDGCLVFAPNLRCWGPVISAPVSRKRSSAPWCGECGERVRARRVAVVWPSPGTSSEPGRRDDLGRHWRRPSDERAAWGADARAASSATSRSTKMALVPVWQARCWERYGIEFRRRSARSRRGLRHHPATAQSRGLTFGDVLRFRLLRRGPPCVRGPRADGASAGRGPRRTGHGPLPEVIVVVVGEDRRVDRVGPIVADVVKRRVLPNVARIVPTDQAACSRASAAQPLLVVQQHFGAPNVA